MIKEYKSCKANVLELLENIESTRNNDNSLIIKYVSNYSCCDSGYKFCTVLDHINIPSILRARRAIQAHPDYKHLRSDKQIERARKKEEYLMSIECHAENVKYNGFKYVKED